MTTLSSALTPVWKFGFPTLWFGLLGLVTVGFWQGRLFDDGGDPPSLLAKLAVTVLWLVGSVALGRSLLPIKRVRLDGDTLRISNYVREIVVPIAAIEAVTEERRTKPRPIHLHFRRRTPFGTRVTFLPDTLIPDRSVPHPTTVMLRDLVEEVARRSAADVARATDARPWGA